MRTIKQTFQAFPYTARCVFTCMFCKKTKRTKSFRVECTVNPFNKHDDGTLLTASEVREQSKKESVTQKEEFLRYPICVKCETEMCCFDREIISEKRKNIEIDGASTV